MRFLPKGSAPAVAPISGSDPLAQRLTLWLPMTERGGGFVRDVSGYNGIGTINTGATWTADGPNNIAINVPAAGNITVPAASVIASTFTMSFAVWANIANFSNYNGIITKTAGAQANPFDWYTASGSGTPRFYVGDSTGGGSIDGTYLPPLGVWCHMGATFSGNASVTTITHYFNGVQAGSGSVSQPVANGSTNLMIGTRGDGVTQANAKFSDARVWCRALLPSEMMMVFLGGLRPWLIRQKPQALLSTTYKPRLIRWAA